MTGSEFRVGDFEEWICLGRDKEIKLILGFGILLKIVLDSKIKLIAL